MAENKNDFTQGSIVTKLLKFMIPILGALVLQAMYGAMDILVVGWFGTTAGISGVSTGSSISRGIGDSKMPLVFVGIACIVNIFGDLLFIAVFQWNVAGAALATVMAQAVSVILSIIIIKKREQPFTMKWEYIRLSPEIENFVRVGTPIAFQEILTQLSFLALCTFINSLGLDASSGYGVANKIVSFIMLVPGALMQSMASFVAQNVGAGLERRARKAMVTGMLIVRLPMSYIMSIQPNASLTMIGLAAPCATVFGIAINVIYYAVLNRENRKPVKYA